MQSQLDVRLLAQQCAQRRWMHPARFGVEKAASGQGYAGFGLGSSKLRLALRFLDIEGQLQHAAVVPVRAFMQLFQ